MERRNGQSQVSFLLPSICEYREFSSEEDYQRTGSNSKLTKTRLIRNGAFSKLSQSFDDDESDPEEEQPLLSKYARDKKVRDEEWKPPKLAKGRKLMQKRRDNKVRNEEWKPKLAKGWKMQKRRVKTAWAKSRRCRQLLRSGLGSSAKALSPLLLLKKIRDGYVSVMTRVASKCHQRMWYLEGARVL